MKSTDLARKDRDLRKSRKRQQVLERKGQRDARSPGDYINLFVETFFYDHIKIYNIESEDMLQLLDEMKEELPVKQWSNVLKKAVKKTQVKEKDSALDMLASLGDIELSNE